MAKRYICLRCFIEYEYLCKGTQYWSPNLVAVSTIFQIFPDKYYTWGPASDLPQCITSRQRRARGGLRLRLEERGNILAQGGAHRGKTHRCRDWNWGCYTDCWVWWELKNSQTWNITVFIRHGTRDNLSFQRFEYLMWIWLCWLWKLPCLLYFECRKANRYQKYKSVELALATVEQEVDTVDTVEQEDTSVHQKLIRRRRENS